MIKRRLISIDRLGPPPLFIVECPQIVQDAGGTIQIVYLLK
jgi:hypothetical protein